MLVHVETGTPIALPTGVDVEPTLFPAPTGADGRHATEVVDRDKNAVALFQLGEVAGVVFGPTDGAPEAARRP